MKYFLYCVIRRVQIVALAFFFIALHSIHEPVKGQNGADYLWGRYIVIEDQIFNNPTPVVYNGYDSIIYRRCSFQERSTNRDAQVIHLTNIGVAKFENCTFKNLRRTIYGDYHGINATTNIDSFIVTNCNFENISADAIQIGDKIYDNINSNYINYVLVDSCVFINPSNMSTENGIDWKGGCNSVGIIQNCTFMGYRYCTTSEGCTGANGEAIAIHYQYSRNLIIRNNKITDGLNGIAVSKGSAGGNTDYEQPPRDILITNNVISCDEMGIQAWYVNNITIQNNIIFNTPKGIWLSNLDGAKINNNTLVNCMDEPLVEYESTIGNKEYTNNLIAGENNGVWMDIQGSNNIEVEDISQVHFLNIENNDFHLTANSEIAIGKGIDNGLNYDIDNESRLNDGFIDVGADEYHSGTEIPNYDNIRIDIVPNPSSGHFSVAIDVESDKIIYFDLINTSGEIVYSDFFRESVADVNFDSTGYYVLGVKIGDKRYSKEVLIINK